MFILLRIQLQLGFLISHLPLVQSLLPLIASLFGLSNNFKAIEINEAKVVVVYAIPFRPLALPSAISALLSRQPLHRIHHFTNSFTCWWTFFLNNSLGIILTQILNATLELPGIQLEENIWAFVESSFANISNCRCLWLYILLLNRVTRCFLCWTVNWRLLKFVKRLERPMIRCVSSCGAVDHLWGNDLNILSHWLAIVSRLNIGFSLFLPLGCLIYRKHWDLAVSNVSAFGDLHLYLISLRIIWIIRLI